MKRLPSAKSSWLTRLGLAVTSALIVVAGLAIASVVFTVLLVLGLAAAGWLWWQYRKLARKISQAARANPDFIEGDYVIEPTPPALTDARTVLEPPPADPVTHAPHRERCNPR